MRNLCILAAFALFIPLMFANLQCSEGSSPETVVVPVGEPGGTGGDPYDTQGDLGCGGDSDAVGAAIVSGSNGDPIVVVTFVGTSDLWVFSLSLPEYEAIRIDISDVWGEEEFSALDRQEIDKLHADLCAPPSEQTPEAGRLYQILKGILNDRIDDMAKEACE